MDFVANSTPIVDLDSRLNSFLVNRDSKLDLPTPESPIRTTATKTTERHHERRLSRETLGEPHVIYAEIHARHSHTFEQVVVVRVFVARHA
jgi:hypothetical protein